MVSSSIKIAMKAIKNILVIHILRNFQENTPQRQRLCAAILQQGFVRESVARMKKNKDIDNYGN